MKKLKALVVALLALIIVSPVALAQDIKNEFNPIRTGVT